MPTEPAIEDEAEPGLLSSLFDNLKIVVGGLIVAFILRIVVFEPYHIPSSSMAPTLMTGDYVFTAKYAYGYSRVSASPIPMPKLSGRFPGGEPRRGDVIVSFNQRTVKSAGDLRAATRASANSDQARVKVKRAAFVMEVELAVRP